MTCPPFSSKSYLGICVLGTCALATPTAITNDSANVKTTFTVCRIKAPFDACGISVSKNELCPEQVVLCIEAWPGEATQNWALSILCCPSIRMIVRYGAAELSRADPRCTLAVMRSAGIMNSVKPPRSTKGRETQQGSSGDSNRTRVKRPFT